MKDSNKDLSQLLESIATALTIRKKNIFEIRAYQNAADSIQHLTSEVKDLYNEDKLDQIPGVGKNIQSYLEEYFKTGKVKHFEELKKGIPEIIFELINIPSVGPKTAQELVNLGIKSVTDLKKQLESGQLIKRGFSQKIAPKILDGLIETENKNDRMFLPFANLLAEKTLKYLKKSPGVLKADALGSLRRKLSTIGDLDFSVSSKNPEAVIKHFIKMPGVARVIDQGDKKASIILNSGLQIDLLVGEPDTYGALLQHFTGSKQHNIKLRTLAEKKGFSLSEYGVKNTKTDKIIQVKTEPELYSLLGMGTPDPEIREDTGEIEAAINKKLPKLIEIKDIKGDFHLHSNFPIDKPSHAPGLNNIGEIVKTAKQLGYEYVGISDHSPSPNLTKPQILSTIEKRTKYIQSLKKNTKSTRVLNGLEIDILLDGSLSVPDEALQTLDYCIAGIHSGHRGTKEQLTKRILHALQNPNLNILAHPTGRLLSGRSSYDANWEEIFKFCAKNKKLLEINASPDRLDLRDDLVHLAKDLGVKFIINTDAHEISHMLDMQFGVSVARRGWVEPKDVINTWDWTNIKEWFNIN